MPVADWLAPHRVDAARWGGSVGSAGIRGALSRSRVEGRSPPALATTAPHAPGSRVHTCATPGKRGRPPPEYMKALPGVPRGRAETAAQVGGGEARHVPGAGQDRCRPGPWIGVSPTQERSPVRAVPARGRPPHRAAWPPPAGCRHGSSQGGEGYRPPRRGRPAGAELGPGDRVAFTEGGQPHAPVVGIDRCARLAGHGPLGGEAGSDDGAAGAVRPCGPRRRTRPPGAACPPRSAPAATASRTPRPAPAAPGRRRAP
ncbi:hypothetical protein BDW27_103340 [Nocardiopsis sp. L17-MgMaSL7]|nr:hypothetical protein BDW27_103340 [Nocardiopsis sp. L17-MgMaSL7]